MPKKRDPSKEEKPAAEGAKEPPEPRGEYCNFAAIHHSETEFVFDFMFQLGDSNRLASRVITSPQHAKALLVALEKNISKYESNIGPIAAPGKRARDGSIMH